LEGTWPLTSNAAGKKKEKENKGISDIGVCVRNDDTTEQRETFASVGAYR
jgi:hypothetical protein